jgi:hypothetical protein
VEAAREGVALEAAAREGVALEAAALEAAALVYLIVALRRLHSTQ